MDKMRYYTVILEGIDKTGKDTIRQYVWQMNKSLNVFCRGYISLEVYNQKFNRGKSYSAPYKDALYVLLTAEKDDWQIRCNISNEPVIDYENDSKLFRDVYNSLDNTYAKMEVNTTCCTAFQIACQIIHKIDELNNNIKEINYEK